MKKQNFVGLLFGFLTIFLAGCATTATEKVEPTVVSGISRVFMHEPGNFTFLVEHIDTKKLGQLRVSTYGNYVTIVEDLSEDQPISVVYSCSKYTGQSDEKSYQCRTVPSNFSNWNVRAGRLTIHLHSAKEIDGAGWNHGKFGRGQTVVVQ
jgi:hypothetical protein